MLVCKRDLGLQGLLELLYKCWQALGHVHPEGHPHQARLGKLEW